MTRNTSHNLPLYGACVFFAIMALSVKVLTHTLPAIEVTFYRSFLCLLVMLPFAACDLTTYKFHRGLWGPLLLRSLAGGLAMIAYFQAISRLPLATAVLLNYTSPLWAALFAWVALGEALSAGVVLAYPLALTGVLLVVGGPGASSDLGAILLGLGSAVLAGAAYTALRGLRGTPASLVVCGLCLVTSLLTAPHALASYQAPTHHEWAGLWVCAVSSALAQYLLTLGFRTCKAASASTVGLATVAISGLLSAAVLGEHLDLRQWTGIAVLLWATSQIGKRSLLARTLRGWRVALLR